MGAALPREKGWGQAMAPPEAAQGRKRGLVLVNCPH